jgi:putative Holliday junction resolvase
VPERGIRVGVDVGSVRIGVAHSDPDGLLATPVATLLVDPAQPGSEVEALVTLVADHDAVLVYVGLPLSLTGKEGPAAGRARAFARELAGRVGPVRVRLVDERLTTVQSHRQLHESGVSGRDQRAVVDQAAAVLILQTALDTERVTGRDAGEPVSADGRKPRKGRRT